MDDLRAASFDEPERLFPHAQLEGVLERVADVLEDNDEALMEATVRARACVCVCGGGCCAHFGGRGRR